jgi:orotate phosphoribosyltransferase
LGADPLVGGLCTVAYQHKKNWRGFLIRKAPKKHGRQKLIEGQELSSSDRIVLLDDVATSGSSLVKAIEILKPYKVKVMKAVVVVDREEDAHQNLSALGCPLFSLFKKNEFF